MPSLLELVRSHTDLDEADVTLLQRLMADWQIIADLSFADLVLWLPDRGGEGFWAAAQMRPTTGPTAYVDDIVGSFVPAGRRPLLDRAYADGRLVREGDPEWRDDVPVRVETIPVPRNGRVVAVVARNTNLLGVRTPSRLELSYLQSAAELTAMIAAGDFPAEGQRSDHADSPRVGDGFVRVDASGQVTYASPNALSVYRRLGWSGDLDGHVLADVTRGLVPPRRRPDEETLSAVLGGRVHRDTEIGDEHVSLIVRAIPLRADGEHTGALVLVRDVTDLRRRDRELVTKDATIREIHHRVKNNLQTVAALLRLQARRIGSPEAKAALEEAVRRVGSIAIVHETLSQEVLDEVGFDEIADRLGAMVTDVGADPDDRPDRVLIRREGSFGNLPNEAANALAMVLTELLQNAVGHGYPDGEGGTITVSPERLAGRLRVTVDDDGVGLPEGFDPDTSVNLGLSIVRTLVESELGGLLELRDRPDRGARVVVDVPVDLPWFVLPWFVLPWFVLPWFVLPRLDLTSSTSSGGRAGAGAAALERAPFVLAQSAPDAVVLAGLEGPLQALLADLTAPAHLLGLLDLEDGRSCVADGEEQLRVLVEAGRSVAPIHGWCRTHFHTETGDGGRLRESVHERTSTVARKPPGDNPLGRVSFVTAPGRSPTRGGAPAPVG